MKCEEFELLEYEQFYIDNLNSKFNVARIAGSCLGLKASEDTVLKLSLLRRGDKNGMYGKTHSEAARTSIKQARTGTKASEETRRKMSEARTGEKNPCFGRKMSEETKAKIAASKKGKPAHNKGLSMSDEQKQKVSKGLFKHFEEKQILSVWGCAV